MSVANLVASFKELTGDQIAQMVSPKPHQGCSKGNKITMMIKLMATLKMMDIVTLIFL